MLRRWWWLLVASIVVGAAVAFGVSTLLTPSYRATTTLLVSQQQTPGVVQLNDLQASERLATTFSRLVTVRPVIERALSDGGLTMTAEELASRITVDNPRTTQLLEVNATASDPIEAARLANAVAEAFIVTNTEVLNSSPGVVSIVESALPPGSPESPRMLLNAALGGLLALMVAAGVALLLEYLDDTVKSSEEIFDLVGLPTLGFVEQFRDVKVATDQLQAANRPRSSIAEAYRQVRTNISYSLDLDSSSRVLLVTSPGPGEGKTTTIANLAVVIGLTGRRVVVVDTDLRRPTLHRVFGLRNSAGLTNLLLSQDPNPQQVAQRTVHHNVSVIAAGPIPPNPSELLGSARTVRVLDQLRAQYDVVLLDSPPALVVTDASVLAHLVDAIALVVRAGHTRSGALPATVTTMAQSGQPILGVVLNRVTAHAGSYYYYGGYGRRGYYHAEDEEQAAQSSTQASAQATLARRGDTNGATAEGYTAAADAGHGEQPGALPQPESDPEYVRD